ncbi:uncharacterized protein I303_102413 [Kwoniella dejecticola CBS 10117]|uniref:Uncharacterized protein n=1 Tax=Kwoniella dejecticola CBS 10117 TaxID=1296121 RepID=A0AAJ8MDZ3_9TREE
MPKGGKNNRRGKKEDGENKRELIFKEDGQENNQLVSTSNRSRSSVSSYLVPVFAFLMTRVDHAHVSSLIALHCIDYTYTLLWRVDVVFPTFTSL